MKPYYQDDLVTLYNADCRAVIPLLSSVEAVITDPPYSSGGMTRSDRMQSTRTKYQRSDVGTEHICFSGDNRDQRGFVAWASIWLSEAMAVCKPGAMLCMFSDWRQLPSLSDAMQVGGWVWRGIVPWDKINPRPMPNRFRTQCEYVLWGTAGPRDFSTHGAVYHAGILRALPPRDRTHATQKPVDIMEQLVAVASPGSLVFDPFCGTGTTLLAAKNTARHAVGCEIQEDICEMAAERLSGNEAMPLLSAMMATDDGQLTES